VLLLVVSGTANLPEVLCGQFTLKLLGEALQKTEDRRAGMSAFTL
jgi:hypothetical protein